MSAWRLTVLWILWPLWWPLALVALLVTAHGHASNPEAYNLARALMWNHARGLALLAFGYRDAK